MTAFRFAILGCGRMGQVHCQRLQADGRARVAALFDSDSSAARRLQNETAREAAVFESLPQLLENADVDAAVICSPLTAHYEQVLACRSRGWHVLCEKPLTDSRERLLALITEADRGGPHCSLAYQRRYWSTYRTLRREVRSERWGAIRAVTVHSVENWQQTIAGTWRDDPDANPGGFVGDAGSHKLDMVYWVTGLEPVEVFARSWNCGSHVEIVTSVSAVLEPAVPLCMDFIGHAQYLGEDFHVHCAQADLMVRDKGVWIARNGRLEPCTALEPMSDPDRGFLDLLEGKAENASPFACALPVFDMTEGIRESSRTGRSVRLQPRPTTV